MFDRLAEILQLGLKSLMRNKLRSFLTMLGLIFGVGSVISMLSVGAGARHEILSRINELGVHNVILNSIEPPEELKADTEDEEWKNTYGLTFDDAERIALTVPTVERILRVNRIKQRVFKGSKRLDASVLGVEPEYLDMFRLSMARGRPFNNLDSEQCAKVCVGRNLERALALFDRPGECPLFVSKKLTFEQCRYRRCAIQDHKGFITPGR